MCGSRGERRGWGCNTCINTLAGLEFTQENTGTSFLLIGNRQFRLHGVSILQSLS